MVMVVKNRVLQLILNFHLTVLFQYTYLLVLVINLLVFRNCLINLIFWCIMVATHRYLEFWVTL